MTDSAQPASRARRGYRALAEDLRERIAAGAITDRLPAEGELVAEYGVARGTVRHALAVLVDEGAIRSTHGKGHFVNGGDASAAKPRYVLVADELERRVRAGQLPADAHYPSEAQLQTEFDVSRTTARRAYEALEERHLVDKRAGRRHVPSAAPGARPRSLPTKAR